MHRWMVVEVTSFFVDVEGGDAQGPEEYNGGIADGRHPNQFPMPGSVLKSGSVWFFDLKMRQPDSNQS